MKKKYVVSVYECRYERFNYGMFFRACELASIFSEEYEDQQPLYERVFDDKKEALEYFSDRKDICTNFKHCDFEKYVEYDCTYAELVEYDFDDSDDEDFEGPDDHCRYISGSMLSNYSSPLET